MRLDRHRRRESLSDLYQLPSDSSSRICHLTRSVDPQAVAYIERDPLQHLLPLVPLKCVALPREEAEAGSSRSGLDGLRLEVRSSRSRPVTDSDPGERVSCSRSSIGVVDASIKLSACRVECRSPTGPGTPLRLSDRDSWGRYESNRKNTDDRTNIEHSVTAERRVAL